MNAETFGPLNQLNAAVLDVGHAETGPLHGQQESPPTFAKAVIEVGGFGS
jgi:hypothetical protein